MALPDCMSAAWQRGAREMCAGTFARLPRQVAEAPPLPHVKSSVVLCSVAFVSDAVHTALALTPAQQATLALLRRGGEPLVFSETFIADLRDEANEAFAHFADRLNGTTMFVTKHTLAGVFDCEAHFLAPDDFSWTPARAKGQVAHRAIQLLINWRGEPVPSELVDDAVARLINEERGLGQWLDTLHVADQADLRAQSGDLVTKFMECFPPLDARSRPVTESSTQWPVDGPILLRGRSDLTIGKPVGRESRKLIVDLKSGRVLQRHREDLRFYGLVETLSRQVPPRMLASFYLDAAEAIVEDVTEGVLRSALRRTLDGINALIEMQVERRPPTTRAGASCRWCPLSVSCEAGRAYLDIEADRDDEAATTR